VLPLYAVFGSPISHSLSPQMHNAAFTAEEMSAHYLPVEVAPTKLMAALHGFRVLGGVGVNLTRPLKETIVPFLQDLSPAAEAAKAANTIVWRDDGWIGDNTDIRALTAKVEPWLGRGRRALVVGSGGAARGSMVALHHLNMEVWVASRSPSDFGDRWIPLADMPTRRDWDVVVNATPLGQGGEDAWVYWPVLSPCQTVVVDWVYHPRETPLLEAADALHCPRVDGLELLIEQARWAWQLLFGRLGPAEAMRRAVQG